LFISTLLQFANWSIVFVSNLPANMYSESRGEARDFARVRNACFEQVIFFNCCLTCRSRAFGEEYTSVTWHLFLHSHLPMLVLLVHVACAWVEFAGIKIYHPSCWMDVSWVCQSIHKSYTWQARQAYLVGNKALAKELSMKGQAYNAQMKAAHEKAREAIYRQRSPTLSLSPDLVEFLIQIISYHTW